MVMMVQQKFWPEVLKSNEVELVIEYEMVVSPESCYQG